MTNELELDQDVVDDTSKLPESSSQESNIANEKSKASKIGEISKFEQDLIDSNVIEESQKTSEIIENIKKEKSTKSLFDSYLDKNLNDFTEGQIVLGRVRAIKKGGVLVDFSYKSDGFVSSAELSEGLSDNLSVGDDIQIMIQKLETKEGYSILSEKEARSELAWEEFSDDMNSRKPVNVVVKKVTAKGYIVSYENNSGFLYPEKDLELKENESVQALILNVDIRRKKLLFSTRNIGDVLEKKEKLRAFLNSVNVGDRLSGKVSGIKKFGVFVNLGDAEGLVHISELSWRRLSHPSEVVSINDEIDVEVLAVDLEKNKLSLGVKQLEKDPWEGIDEKIEVGQTVEGTVIRITSFGAFVLVGEGLEGLIHISEISKKRISNIEDILKVNEKCLVKVLKVSKIEQKIGLSLKSVDQVNEDLVARLEASS